MSTISAGNTTTTSIVVTGDTTGNIVISTTGGVIFANSSTPYCYYAGFCPASGTECEGHCGS